MSFVIEVIAITAVRDGRTIFDGVGNSIDDGSGACAFSTTDFQRHDADIPVDACNANAVVADSADDTRAMRAVADIVRRIVIVVEEVVTDQLAITVEDVVLQIRMRVFDTTVDNGDHDFARTGKAQIPERLHVDVATSLA